MLRYKYIFMMPTHNIPIITISGTDVQLRIDMNVCIDHL